ncbi:MAG: DNA mismatch repair protein [Flavobacterium sp.]|nr:DNA mismatch repair protein [Flavobacterium sp.]|tara:strand:+ start:3727 stop:5499 length:1773 start_codon:yes stop_codon:yes gene_type:complete
MDFYISRVKSFSAELTKYKNQYNAISTARFLVAVIFLVFIYLAIRQDNISGYIIPSLSLVVIFIVLLRLHSIIVFKKQRAATLVAINEDELNHLSRRGSNFYNGSEFADPKHPYSHDLDIFGDNSLYQHLNRTETYRGSQKLAKSLLTLLPQTEILRTQEAVKELAAKPEWRQEVQALGRIKKDSGKTYNTLIHWSKTPAFTTNVLSTVLSVAGPVALAVCFAGYLITGNGDLLSACTYIFSFNLLATMAKAKAIKNEAAGTTAINEIVNQYRLIINSIEQQNFRSEKLNEIKSKLGNGNMSAGSLIKKLALLFGQLDTVANVFAAILFNGLFQYHVHIFRALQLWKRKHAAQIPQWLDAIAETEALSSLANFSYNNPGYAFPELNSRYAINFKNLAHPLLNPQKRIGNDITFTPCFTILTGSNMSGKSTFLRSLGINMVLAGAGAPVCAVSADVHPLPVLVSMRLSDSLSDSESYFFAEIKRLKFIMDELDSKRSFVLLDEILRGTNSDDKRTGTIEVVKKMVQKQVIGAIATHDIEVCNIADDYPDSLVNRCFEVEIAQEELHFDYTLRNGICRNKSATFLMKKTGVI